MFVWLLLRLTQRMYPHPSNCVAVVYHMKWTWLKSTLLAWRVSTCRSQMPLPVFNWLNAVSAFIFPEHMTWACFTDSITFLYHLWPSGFAMPCLIVANNDKTLILLLRFETLCFGSAELLQIRPRLPFLYLLNGVISRLLDGRTIWTSTHNLLCVCVEGGGGGWVGRWRRALGYQLVDALVPQPAGSLPLVIMKRMLKLSMHTHPHFVITSPTTATTNPPPPLPPPPPPPPLPPTLLLLSGLLLKPLHLMRAGIPPSLSVSSAGGKREGRERRWPQWHQS